MSGINDLGKNYLEEYKAFGAKVLSENEQILKKSGVTPPVFNTVPKSNDTSVGLVLERTQKEDDKKKNSEEDTNDCELFEKTSILKNSTLMDVRSSAGKMNTVYKNSIKAKNIDSNNQTSNSFSGTKAFSETLEELNGKDNNDDMAEFMSREYDNGLHVNGGGYVYYEKSDDGTSNSVTANVIGTYKTNNEKLTLSYGGSFEYDIKNSVSNQNGDYVQSQNGFGSKSGNTVFMAKYKAEDFTYAVGETSNFYESDTKLYHVYTGIMHNESGIAATLIRKIEVTAAEDGNHIENKTNVKLHLLKPKKAEKQDNIAPQMPSPAETAELRNIVQKNKQEVGEININKGYGFGMDLKLASSQDADEYGVEVTYSSLLTKKSDKNNVVSITPYIGAYDYHPNTNEGLKVRTGIIGKLESKVGSDFNISSQLIIDNKRIMRNELHPANTFMVSSDTTVSKNKFRATVSAGHINSNSEVKYYFIIGDFEYTMKNSAISANIGYQDYSYDGGNENSKNKVFHTGLRYTVNF